VGGNAAHDSVCSRSVQSFDWLLTEYGRDHAEALVNLPANLLTSQVTGDSARFTSEQIGKILQERSTVSTNNRGTSTSRSMQLAPALPPSKIATLSSGEFVGITADSPDQPMPLKAVHCQVQLEKQPVHKPISQPTKLIS